MNFSALAAGCCLFLFSSCAQSPSASGSPAVEVPELPATVQWEPEVEKSIAIGWPFAVKATVYGFDKPPRFVENLRGHFLQPLTQSRFAARIASVEIHCENAEYEQWSCTINLSGGHPPLRLNRFAAFYNGSDADPYQEARRTVLATLATRP